MPTFGRWEEWLLWIVSALGTAVSASILWVVRKINRHEEEIIVSRATIQHIAKQLDTVDKRTERIYDHIVTRRH